MKVLIITGRADTSGGPEHVYQLISHCEVNIDWHISCPDEWPYADRYRKLIKKDVLRIKRRSFNIIDIIRLCRYVKENNIEIIHSHGKAAGLYSRIVGAILHVKVIHTFHGVHLNEYGLLKRKIYIEIEKFLSMVTDRFIFVSSGEKSQAVSLFRISSLKVNTIENGVDIGGSVCADKCYDVVSINRFNEQKNPELLLEISKILGKMKPGIRIIVLGDGEKRGDWEGKFKVEGAEICLVGAVGDVRLYLKKSKVFLSTSRWEGMPIAVLEAMSEGLPLVVTNVVGNKDIVLDGENGFLFELNKPDIAAELVLKLLDNSDMRENMGNSGREIVSEQYSSHRMAQRTIKIYDWINF